MADLLFSQEMDGKGNPKGIGLSIWRYNLGAGSADQGVSSGIGDAWRRGQSFLQADGSYDWSAMSGQVWFAKAAKERNVEKLLLFCNSPHVSMTRNRKAYSDSGSTSNLEESRYDDFADYLVKSVEGMFQMGLEVDYISPVNEPQWDWADGGQEGTPFWNHEIAGIARVLNQQLQTKDLTTKIDIAEAAQLNFLYEQADKPGRASQLGAFFDSNSENYLGNLSHISKAVSGHSYFTTSPKDKLWSVREQLSQASTGVDFWMSEYCILGGNDGEIDGNGRDLGMTPALYMAKVIHADLTVANAAAWHWWLAISPYDYKDGLIYIDKNQNDGTYSESKMLWTLGNYSRFVRPGYVRMDVQTKNSPLLVSAYKSPDGNKSVVVVINTTPQAQEVDFTIPGKNLRGVYVTSDTEDLALQTLENDEQFSISARSVTTFIFE